MFINNYANADNWPLKQHQIHATQHAKQQKHSSTKYFRLCLNSSDTDAEKACVYIVANLTRNALNFLRKWELLIITGLSDKF